MNISSDKVAWRDRIYTGDCQQVAAGLPQGTLDLIYVDPPYFTKKDFAGRLRGSGEPDAKTNVEHVGFGDRWQGGRHEYLAWLEPRVLALRSLLSPNGVFLLHLDWHVVHYAKVLCDRVFGDECFQNELIWYYQTGGAGKGRFSRKHDSILLYSRGPKFYFDGKSIAIPRGAGAMKRAQCATGARIKATDTHKNPDDVLIVPALNPMAVERTGYPTQKLLALLERLIVALCPPEGVVGDFFCGSGTTLMAARKLGRHYVGCDVNAKAVAIAQGRLGLR